MSDVRIGTSGGTIRPARAPGTASSIRAAAAGRSALTSSPFTPSTSTRLRSIRPSTASRAPTSAADGRSGRRAISNSPSSCIRSSRTRGCTASAWRSRSWDDRDGGAGDLRPDFIDALARPNDADLDEFRRGIDPLASTGKLGALLAQFPPSFKDTPESQDYLSDLLRRLAGYPVAVELRHRSWSDRIGDTLGLLNGFNAAWVQIDEPKFRFRSGRTTCRTSRASTTCGCTAGTPRSGGGTTSRRPLRLPVFERRVEGVFRDGRCRQAAGQEALPLRQHITSPRSRSPMPR
jgi:hypothetical protein